MEKDKTNTTNMNQNVKYWKFKLNMIKDKTRLLLILAVLLILPFVVFLTLRGVKILTTRAGTARLYFEPSSSSVYTGDTVTLSVLADSGTTPVGAIHVDIMFDRSKLALKGEVTSSTILKRVIQKTSKSQTDTCVTTCKITLAQGLDPLDKNNPPKGIFDLAKITFTPVARGANIRTTVSINSTTAMVVETNTRVFTKIIQNATIIINPTNPTITGRVTPTPTRPPNVSPTPRPSVTSPPDGLPYRAFSNDSYWNTPMPINAPIDSRSAVYIADSQNSSHTQNYLRFTAAPGTSQGFGQPIYWASPSDKLYTISDGNLTVQVHIPRGAAPASGSDGQITIYDQSTNQVVGMSGASYNSSSDTWHVSGSIDRYMLNSNGLDRRVSGSNSNNNYGHRGITTAVRAVRLDEVQAGVIRHRLACFWWATGTQTVNHYWPMAGDEGSKGGIVPEGIVIRIKPSVNLASRGLSAPALVIAKALQDYGCMIGDNSGSGNRLKLELNEAAWRNIGLTYDALAPIPWSDWEFIQGGYNP